MLTELCAIDFLHLFPFYMSLSQPCLITSFWADLFFSLDKCLELGENGQKNLKKKGGDVISGKLGLKRCDRVDRAAKNVCLIKIHCSWDVFLAPLFVEVYWLNKKCHLLTCALLFLSSQVWSQSSWESFCTKLLLPCRFMIGRSNCCFFNATLLSIHVPQVKEHWLKSIPPKSAELDRKIDCRTHISENLRF